MLFSSCFSLAKYNIIQPTYFSLLPLIFHFFMVPGILGKANRFELVCWPINKPDIQEFTEEIFRYFQTTTN